MRILLVSPHPDDAEIGCAGTVIKLKEMRKDTRIWAIYFCPCGEDPKNKGNLEEWRAAMDVLGVEKKIEGNFPRDVLEYRMQEVRDCLWKIKQEFKPDIIFCPPLGDLHQDHRAVANCCLTIFRDSSTILGYEIPRSAGKFSPNLFVTLTDEQVHSKMTVLEKWVSQFKARPNFFNWGAFFSTLRLRGLYVGTRHAEAFELIWGRL